MILRARQHLFEFPRRPVVMGSVRVGVYEDVARREEAVSAALLEAQRFADWGAEIIVVSVEASSQSAGRAPSDEYEAEVLSGFVRRWRKAARSELLAAQTACPRVAQVVLATGVDLLVDRRCAREQAEASFAGLCAKHGTALVLEYAVQSHSCASASDTEADVVVDAQHFFEEALRSTADAGLSKEAVLLGFRLDAEESATAATSLRLAARIGRFHCWGRPLLLTDPSGCPSVPTPAMDTVALERKTAAMVARMVHGLLEGVQFFQGGNVQAVSAAVRTIRAVVS